MSICENIICQLVDSAADSKLKRLKAGETFGIEKPGGEARLYVGQVSNEEEFDSFFGFNELKNTQSFKVYKSDLLDYLLRAKGEFLNPQESYRLKIADFYESFISQVLGLDDEFEIQFRKNIDKQRYYLSPEKEGGRRYSQSIRRICLPYLTRFNFIRTVDEQGKSEYFFKLIFSDSHDKESKEAVKLSDALNDLTDNLAKIVTAIRTKPFVLLAGISGTGKSRIVRQLAKACWPIGSEENKAHKPSNFEMVQVKPNWHDSSELLGYVSRIGNKPEFIAGDFLKFVARAWENPEVPYFLCLDEMNLAPVEQYFAEYLSVVESRKLQEDGIMTDPILRKEDEEWYFTLTSKLTSNDEVRNDFNKHGIRIPHNLIVVGTVNMDETTYSFSRKVLDRAMTIEMNEVDLNGGLDKSKSNLPHIKPKLLLADAVEGYDVYQEEFKDDCDTVIKYLGEVNDVLANTPFRVAYRTRNEFLIYVVNAIRMAGEDTDRNKVIADALDEVTSMKILSRIEGDKRKVHFLDSLTSTVKSLLDGIDGGDRSEENSISLAKLKTMGERLKSGYTSFWD